MSLFLDKAPGFLLRSGSGLQSLSHLGEDGKTLRDVDVILDEVVLIPRPTVHNFQLEQLRGVVVPVVLLECPVVVAEEAVLALHADFTVVELSAVPRFEDTTKLLCCLARELVGPVGEGTVLAEATLRGLEPVLADLGLVPHIEGHVRGHLECHLNLRAKWHWHEALMHLLETRWRERRLLHRHVAMSAGRETGHECGDKLRRGGLEGSHIGLERVHRSSRSGATART